MSKKEDYTAEEWRSLQDLSCVGVTQLFDRGVKNASVGLSDVASKIREVLAMIKYADTAKKQFAGNSLILDLIDSFSAGVKAEGKSVAPMMLEKQQIRELIAEVNSILAQKSDDQESGEFRAMVYSLAFEIANASGDGFLGFGERINAKEADFLKFLKEELIGNA